MLIIISITLLFSWLYALQNCVFLCPASFVGHGKAQVVTFEKSNLQALKNPGCPQIDRGTLLHFVAQFQHKTSSDWAKNPRNATELKKCVLIIFEITGLRAEEPRKTAELRYADWENVFVQVTSQVKGFPSLYVKTVTPSGFLLASKSRPEGSKIKLKPEKFKA